MGCTTEEATDGGVCEEVCLRRSARKAACKDVNALKVKEKTQAFKFGFLGLRPLKTASLYNLRQNKNTKSSDDEAKLDKRRRNSKVTNEQRKFKELKEYLKVNKDALAKSAKKMEKNEVKNLMEQDSKCALAAIEYYNKKHGTDYVLVETLGSYIKLIIGFWYHCNFRAQSKKETESGLG